MECTKCHACGELSVYAALLPHREEIAGHTYCANLPGRRCSACGASVVDKETRASFELAVARHMAEYGPVSGETLRHMRKSIRLASKVLAEMLHVTPETISRWENGERGVDFASWLVTGDFVLDRTKRTLSTVERIVSVEEGPGTREVHLTIARGGHNAAM